MGFSAFRGRWDYRVSRPPAPLRNAAAQRRRMAPTKGTEVRMTCSFKRGTVRVPADEEPSWAEVAPPIVPQMLVRSGTGVSIGNL